MHIITISGVDGSGKSTQIDLLKKHLEDAGAKVHYFHSVQFSLANRHKSGKPGTAKAVTKASWYKIQLRKFIFLIDLLRFESLLTKLQKNGYTHLVSDRYFYDTLINILYLSHSQKTHSFGVLFLEKLVRQPHHAFFLHVPIDEIMRRERDIEQDTDYLTQKSELFLNLISRWHIAMITGDREKNVIAEEIYKKITSLMSS